MIAWLSGIIRALGTNFVVLDVQGVGYQVSMTQQSLAQLAGVGTHLSLYIETQVREDAITLFGFTDTIEKEWFQRLITVQGVGAKMALNLLSTLSPDLLLRAIMSDDKAALTRADGVGPKLAVRLLTELKEPAKKLYLNISPSAVLKSTGSKKALSDLPDTSSSGQTDQLIREATSALVNLGYAPSDALQAVSQAVKEQDLTDVSALIKAGLKAMAA